MWQYYITKIEKTKQVPRITFSTPVLFSTRRLRRRAHVMVWLGHKKIKHPHPRAQTESGEGNQSQMPHICLGYPLGPNIEDAYNCNRCLK